MLAFLLASCAGQKFVGRPDLQLVKGDLPAPVATDMAPQRPTQLGANDKIVVDVYGVPDLSKTVIVDSSGQVSLPLAGTLDAAGKTPSELSRMIEDRLRGRYVRDPQVTVNLDTSNQVVTVDGEVNQPGLFPVVGRMTLMRTIASARGLTAHANTNFVVVFRQVNNQKMAALYDLRAIRVGAYEDPQIYPNDVVFVGESTARRLFDTVIQSSGLITVPLIALLQ